MDALLAVRRALAGGFVGAHREICAAFDIPQNRATAALHELVYCGHATYTESGGNAGYPKKTYSATPKLLAFMEHYTSGADFENRPLHIRAAENLTPLERQWFDVVRGEEQAA